MMNLDMEDNPQVNQPEISSTTSNHQPPGQQLTVGPSEPKLGKKWWLVLLAGGLLVVGMVIGGYWLALKSRVSLDLVPGVPTATPDVSPPPGTGFPASSEVVTAVSGAHNRFGLEVFKALFEKEPPDFENIFISPSSIALALSMTYNGAEGETKAAMARTLHFQQLSNQQINQVSKQLLDSLESGGLDPQVDIAIANSIWAREGVLFLPEFLNTNQRFFDAQVSAIDFSLASSADMINAWVSDHTRGKIPTIVQPPISPGVMMYLINAVYFKGTWTYEFDEELTEEREFTPLPNKNLKMHPLMRQEREDFEYLETDDFQAVKLPYGEKQRMFMYVFLPKGTIPELVSQLSMEKWEEWAKSFGKREGTLLLPKFKMEYEKELKNILSDLGMGIAFTGEADFSQMSEDVELMIYGVLHKTFVEVNEEGTEAAAATSIMIGITSVGYEPSRFYMEVNKPFLFAIGDEKTGEVLFMGVVRDPGS